MNVLLVSQCDKRALVETRRILDQFAERRGDRTWQTSITEAGLDTLRKLLRRTARKNTAVACHWIRGRDHTELLWIVGDARRFNAQGAVPTNTTMRDVLRREDENDWHSAEDIRLLAQLSALLHDLGKASEAFQQRLRNRRDERNLVRHEWVSLRLFLAFVGDDDDEGWLRRLAGDQDADAGVWTEPGRYLRDRVDTGIGHRPFAGLSERAPLAAAVGWLVVTHHRLPVAPDTRLGVVEPSWLRDPLSCITHAWNEVRGKEAQGEDCRPYWELAGQLPVVSPAWRKQAARVARRLLERLRQNRQGWLDNLWALHLARMCLMLADHHYSKLGVDAEGRPVAERRPFAQPDQVLYANTRRDRHGKAQLNQSLLEHLLGVGHVAGQVAHALPRLERHLPRIASHRGLRRRSSDQRFAWQDRAFDAATAMREAARDRGAFVVNMASTGSGKTLANARILYALADPQRGMRATYALGLRTLTLQTGRAYRRDLHLGEDELAVLVGGSANRVLFEFHEARAEADGSASAQSLLEEDSHVFYEGDADHPVLARVMSDPQVRRLLWAPLAVCTVDHLVPACESLRGGRQIAPLLRLLGSDLVLDELDDYDIEDLPALSRLVFFAGMYGARVVLSSATMPPALVDGMFRAYQAGRREWSRNRGPSAGREDGPVEVPCLWVDELVRPQTVPCADPGAFSAAHARFVEQRVARLQEQKPLRIARLHRLEATPRRKREEICRQFAAEIGRAAFDLHRHHAGTDPLSGQRVSFGIVRMANIDPLIEVARALSATPPPEGIRLHLCVYHARFPLVRRAEIEAMLDEVFDRRDEGRVWSIPSVRCAIDDARDHEHVFMVLASPVCEVGRDWDADWAIAEPSSMRSVIQLAGRVRRHRQGMSPSVPNVVVFDTNLRALLQPGKPAFVRPGFEKDTLDQRFLLASHRLSFLRPDSRTAGGDGERIDAIPRIRTFPDAFAHAREHLVALEHARMEAAMQPLPEEAVRPQSAPAGRPSSRGGGSSWLRNTRDLACLVWQFPQATLLGVLPRVQPFRHDPEPDRTLVFLPDEEEETLIAHRVEDDPRKWGQDLYVRVGSDMLHPLQVEPASGVRSWGDVTPTRLLELVRELAEFEGLGLREAACRFTVVEVRKEKENEGKGWEWHPWLGFRLA